MPAKHSEQGNRERKKGAVKRDRGYVYSSKHVRTIVYSKCSKNNALAVG